LIEAFETEVLHPEEPAAGVILEQKENTNSLIKMQAFQPPQTSFS